MWKHPERQNFGQIGRRLSRWFVWGLPLPKRERLRAYLCLLAPIDPQVCRNRLLLLLCRLKISNGRLNRFILLESHLYILIIAWQRQGLLLLDSAHLLRGFGTNI